MAIDTHFFKNHWRLEKLISHQPSFFMSIIEDISQKGGRALLVGGCVRDLFLESDVKDIDIEVHGIEPELFESILSLYGVVDFVGKSFGVYRLYGLDIDWSFPRSDLSGRKPQVTIDPFMSLKDAFARRDLTINAMGIDLVTFELIDPFNGKEDLDKRILRAPDVHFFAQDPLRFFRVMQFVARFDMYPDDELQAFCSQMDVCGISRERIEVECEKMFLRSKQPSKGIRWLYALNRLSDIFPEIYALITVPQDPLWHPEGTVFEHTMQAIDAAVFHVQKYEAKTEKLILFYAALCHDFGKVVTTINVDGRIRSPGHAQKGVEYTKRFLARIMQNSEIIHAVCQLVWYHMHPMQFIASNASLASYKRVAAQLKKPVTMQMLADLFCIDRQARNPQKEAPLMECDQEAKLFLEQVKKAGVLYARENALLLGKDIMSFVEPGPKMGEALRYAYALQINESINDKQVLLKRVQKWVYAKKK